jgi:putative DNA primase/helicase
MSELLDEPPEYDPLEHPGAQVIQHPNARQGGLPETADEALALKFTARHGDKLRYVKLWDKWLHWNGQRWEFDATHLVLSFARELCRTEAARIISPIAAKAVGSARAVKAVEFLARADRTHAATTDQWDAQPWLLGTPEGTVDLRTGIHGPAIQQTYIRRQTAVVPAPPGTPAPIWSAFLTEATQGDEALQGFIQRLCGYLLTGAVNEEILTFVYGPGGAGKGVVLSTISRILGDYAVAVPIEVFTASSRINLEYYRAKMDGVRLVTASETEAQTTWAESAIKELTGNETPISGRHPYGEPFTFRPQFKIVLVGNHAPRLKGRSAAMERRLRVIPFSHVVDTPDLDLKEKMASEYPAILRWMIDGCRAWKANGLGICPAVAAATGSYFETQDGFRNWIDERCILDPHLQLAPSILLADFNAWAKASGEEAMNAMDFAELMDRMQGVRRMKTDGGRVVRGIGLKADKQRETY